MRKRVRLSWQLESNTPTGVTARWLLQQNFKDHALEAVLAFWYPFALQGHTWDESTVNAVSPLIQAEALLAITRLERQVALLRQTFGLEYLPPVTLLPTAMVPDSNSLPPAPLPTVPGMPTERVVVSGFESFDTSLSADT